MKYESEYYGVQSLPLEGYLQHHGIPKQKWGVRRFQYKDGSLTPAGKERYGVGTSLKKPGQTAESKKTSGEFKKTSDEHSEKSEKKNEKALSGADFDGDSVDMAKARIHEKTQKSNADRIKKGKFDLEDDDEGKRLKTEIEKNKKALDDADKERVDFHNNGELFEKYQRQVADEEWEQLDDDDKEGWTKDDWTYMYLYEDFGQNDEAFTKYLADQGRSYDDFDSKVNEAYKKFEKSVEDYVDHSLGSHGDTVVIDKDDKDWDARHQRWVPRKTTARKALSWKLKWGD